MNLLHRTIDGYQVRARIAMGGMATVWRAEKAGRSAAIKVLRAERASSRKERAAFRREYLLCRALNHPALIHYESHGVFEGAPYIVMEYFASRTLRHMMVPEELRATRRQADAIVSCTAHALQYLHEHGILHLDVKPENILVNGQGEAKLIDFSCAMKGWRTWIPWRRKAAGSPTYVAPEQLLKRTLGPTADIYGLGAVLYELYAGVPPFVGESEREMLARKVAGEIRPLLQFDRRIQKPFAELVHEMLEVNPADRMRSMHEFLTRFARVTPFEKTRSDSGRRRILAAPQPAIDVSGELGRQ